MRAKPAVISPLGNLSWNGEKRTGLCSHLASKAWSNGSQMRFFLIPRQGNAIRKKQMISFAGEKSKEKRPRETQVGLLQQRHLPLMALSLPSTSASSSIFSYMSFFLFITQNPSIICFNQKQKTKKIVIPGVQKLGSMKPIRVRGTSIMEKMTGIVIGKSVQTAPQWVGEYSALD